MAVCLGNHTWSILTMSVWYKAEGQARKVPKGSAGSTNSLRVLQSASFIPLSHDRALLQSTSSELFEGRVLLVTDLCPQPSAEHSRGTGNV